MINNNNTNNTLDVLTKNPHIKIIYQPFDNFTEQYNFNLTHIRTN
jgi:hypothetical protein